MHTLKKVIAFALIQAALVIALFLLSDLLYRLGLKGPFSLKWSMNTLFSIAAIYMIGLLFTAVSAVVYYSSQHLLGRTRLPSWPRLILASLVTGMAPFTFVYFVMQGGNLATVGQVEAANQFLWLPMVAWAILSAMTAGIVARWVKPAPPG